MRRELTNREALVEQMRLNENSVDQLTSANGKFVARAKKGSTSEWILYQLVDGYRHGRIRVASLTTRNKDVVHAVLDMLADFGARGAL